MAPFWKRRDATQQRDTYARTSGDLLVNDAGPSGMPFVWWLGVDSGGGANPIGPNGPHSVSSHPLVVRATALITGPLTAGAFKVVDESAIGRVLPSPRWITDPMLVRPDDRFAPSAAPAAKRLTRSLFWTDWIRSALWFGEGIILAAEDANGAPLAGTMRLIHPHAIDTVRIDGVWRWRIGSGINEAIFDREGRIVLGNTTYRLTVLRNPLSTVSDEGRSAGVFELSPEAFQLGKQIQTYASGTFRSGIPAGYLKVNAPHLSQTAADELKTAWLAAHGGDRRSIAVLNATTEFTPLAMSPVDAALGEVKKLNNADVAMAFGLDPMTLGASTGSGTYTNLRDAWSNHRDFGLTQMIAGVQDTLTALLPGTQAVKVDLTAFANPTEAEQNASDEVALRAGILTLDEVRARRGLPPLPPAPPPAPDPVPEPPVLDPPATEEDAEDA